MSTTHEMLVVYRNHRVTIMQYRRTSCRIPIVSWNHYRRLVTLWHLTAPSITSSFSTTRVHVLGYNCISQPPHEHYHAINPYDIMSRGTHLTSQQSKTLKKRWFPLTLHLHTSHPKRIITQTSPSRYLIPRSVEAFTQPNNILLCQKIIVSTSRHRIRLKQIPWALQKINLQVSDCISQPSYMDYHAFTLYGIIAC